MNQKSTIRCAVVGVGNCCSALVQGVEYYRAFPDAPGLISQEIGGYQAGDIDIVWAADIDARKVGKPLNQAIFSRPNCTKVFHSEVSNEVVVHMGSPLDGRSDYHNVFDADDTCVLADQPAATKAEIVQGLRESAVDMLISYLPVGSVKATEFYMECALEAGVAIVNCMPVFIASDKNWEARFREKGLPMIGDDIKSQVGATITHRVLSDIIGKRGAVIDQAYQLNMGGNTDFLNMLDRDRLEFKKLSKTQAVRDSMHHEIADKNIHIGPSDHVPWLDDNKICYIRINGRMFGNVPFNMDVKLSVEDSPNSAAVVVDAVRYLKEAKDQGVSGVLKEASQKLMKHPPAF